MYATCAPTEWGTVAEVPATRPFLVGGAGVRRPFHPGVLRGLRHGAPNPREAQEGTRQVRRDGCSRRGGLPVEWRAPEGLAREGGRLWVTIHTLLGPPLTARRPPESLRRRALRSAACRDHASACVPHAPPQSSRSCNDTIASPRYNPASPSSSSRISPPSPRPLPNLGPDSVRGGREGGVT